MHHIERYAGIPWANGSAFPAATQGKRGADPLAPPNGMRYDRRQMSPPQMRAPSALPPTIAEMVRYGLVGLVNTAVGFSTIAVAMQALHWHYATANVLGYGLGLTVSFVLNKRFTFRSPRAIRPREPLLFLLVFGVSYAIQMGALVLCVEALRMNRLAAQAIAMALYTAIGYAGNKYLTFRARKASVPPDQPGNRPASC
jgi:putative flippase GtrA